MLLLPFGVTLAAGLVVSVLVGTGPEEEPEWTATAQASEAESIPEQATGMAPQRLTPERESLPELPDQQTLEAAATAVPEDHKQSVWPGDRWYGVAGFEGQPASPLFSDGNELIGVWVAGLGTVDVDSYRDSHLDLEDLLIDRIGEHEYQNRRDAQDAAHNCGYELGSEWSHDELLECVGAAAASF